MNLHRFVFVTCVKGIAGLGMLAACNSEPAKVPPAKQTPAPAAPTNDLPGDARSAETAAAADVLQRYYAALQARDFKTAYALWSDHGQASKQTFEAFQAGFAATRATRVELETPGDVEGAAGSLYVSIPVQVYAELNDGQRQHFSGNYVLRRVNDVAGSSAEQRTWHIASATLRAK